MSSDIRDLRFTLRFVATSPLTGSFGTASVSIVDIGETGAQVEHPQPLRLATKGRLLFRSGADNFASYGVVVWSHLSKTPDDKGKLLYRSGVRFEDDSVDFAKLIDTLLARGIIKPDDDSLERKRQRVAQREAERSSKQSVLRPVQHIDINSDRILLIQHARDRLRTHPDEAMKWYNRAKYSIAQNPGNAHEMLYHREEVLAVWEYLERTVDIQIIARVFELKKTGEGPPA